MLTGALVAVFFAVLAMLGGLGALLFVWGLRQ